MYPKLDDWRARIEVLAGGATIEAMLAFAACQGAAADAPRRSGWTATVGWFRAPRVYRARVYRADRSSRTEGEHPTDPAVELTRALLTAADSKSCRGRMGG
jgi:hypothetical protein